MSKDTLAQAMLKTIKEDEEINKAGGLTDADMLARMPASQRAGFLKSIGSLEDTPRSNSLDRSNAPDETERKRRIDGAGRAVTALKAEAQQAAVTVKLPKDDDDLTEILNKPMSLNDMIRKAEEASRR